MPDAWDKLVGGGVVGFVVAFLSIIPIPTVPTSTFAMQVLGFFLAVVVPILSLIRDVEDVRNLGWGYGLGLLSGGAVLYTAPSFTWWPIIGRNLPWNTYCRMF